jgi:hypothetical protein
MARDDSFFVVTWRTDDEDPEGEGQIEVVLLEVRVIWPVALRATCHAAPHPTAIADLAATRR